MRFLTARNGYSIARPIATLSVAANRIGTGDRKVKVPIERNDELGQLASHFKDMVLSIRDHQSELMRAEQLAGHGRVAAGIAHELNNPVSTRGLVEAVIANVRVTGAPLAVSIDVRGDAVVQGDESRLRQVGTNLLGNAVEGCGEQGQISVVIDKTNGDTVGITARDNGVGVREENRARIVEPFFTRKHKGTASVWRFPARSPRRTVAISRSAQTRVVAQVFASACRKERSTHHESIGRCHSHCR